MVLFLSLLTSEILAFLGFLVFFHDRKNVTNKIFFTYSLVIAAWSMINYFSVTVPPEDSLIWIRLVLFLAVPHVFLFFLFVKNFPSKKLTISIPQLVIHLSLMGLMMYLAVSPFVFQGIVIDGSLATPIPGPLIGVFSPLLNMFVCFNQTAIKAHYHTLMGRLEGLVYGFRN